MVESIALAGSPVHVQGFDMDVDTKLGQPLIERILALTSATAPLPVSITVMPDAVLVTLTLPDAGAGMTPVAEVLPDGRTVARFDR